MPIAFEEKTICSWASKASHVYLEYTGCQRHPLFEFLEISHLGTFYAIVAGHSGMGGPVGILVGFELRVSGHSLKPTEYKSIILCSKSYIFMVKN